MMKHIAFPSEVATDTVSDEGELQDCHNPMPGLFMKDDSSAVGNEKECDEKIEDKTPTVDDGYVHKWFMMCFYCN